MTAIVSVETVLLVVLLVLVAGLLRSHAEILRRLGPTPDLPPPAPRRGSGPPAPLAGVTPAGDVVQLAFDMEPTLLAFLSTGCSVCRAFWDRLGAGVSPAGLRTVIVTHAPARERLAKLRSLAPTDVPIVMSEPAWGDYAVPGSPYFVLIDAGGVRGEGVASTWEALDSLVRDALLEEGPRGRDIDEILQANGIGPDHPSLYPRGLG